MTTWHALQNFKEEGICTEELRVYVGHNINENSFFLKKKKMKSKQFFFFKFCNSPPTNIKIYGSQFTISFATFLCKILDYILCTLIVLTSHYQYVYFGLS